MRQHSIAIAALSLLLAIRSHADDTGGWVDRQGNPVPNTDAMKSVSGFGGWLVVTPDATWETEWNTPTEHTPNIRTTDKVRVGEVLAILPVFINPKLDEDGFARVLCDVRVTRADNSVAIDESNLNCFNHKLSGDPKNVWLSAIIPKFSGEQGDPVGTWIVEMTLKDDVRGVEVPLKTSFTLIDEFATQTIACSYSAESFSDWMMTYFREPMPEALPCALEYYSDSELFLEHPDSRMLTAYFFASAMPSRQYDFLYSTLSKSGSLESKLFALHVFWVNATPTAEKLIVKAGKEWSEPEIQAMVPKMLDQDAWQPLLDGPRSAGDLDNLWAIYFATGNEKAIKQIAGALPLSEEGHGTEIAIGGAARWSLTSNSSNYPEVRLAVIELHAEARGLQKELLKEVIDDSGNNSHKESGQTD